MSRYITDEPLRPEERFALYRVCGPDRHHELVATCATPEAIGVALYTLALEGEFSDPDCPIGVLDRLPEPGNPKWLIRPWLAWPTPKNVSDAGRTLRQARERT